MVGVSVEVDGRFRPLYPAPDGSDRWYLEAAQGSRYAILLANRTGERLGVVVTVDGLNAISGLADTGIGRMYVLGPWDQTTVRGWRTSLSEVRRFTFVDEQASYAARSGKANSKMGWIEIAVYREHQAYVRRPWYEGRSLPYPNSDAAGAREHSEVPPASAEAPPPTAKAAPQGARPSDQADAAKLPGYGASPSFPGTGWGSRADDPVVLVSFDPEPTPAERVTLRYEYAGALRALGVLPQPWYPRDRLSERERGEMGFARPPIN
jgi:hypothetical protein